MMAFFFKLRDTGEPPRATRLSDHWHPPQFSKIYDPHDRQTRVAMLITSPEPLFDADTQDFHRQIDALVTEINRITRYKWTCQEAAQAASLFPAHPSKGFLAILEHGSNGSYATRNQQIKAYYAFDGKRIGGLEPRGMIVDHNEADMCLTV
ncbi:hypothetical protein [Celeribacter halophilus]|uniref:Uncharacterized protein n=1 Tax=Celeribacter halophilus TaxID=576117 RepID=A0A1I3W0H9_9RHOB|nr:hypothetical protein [Celeribacter halophilus]PZX06824.1 hypothetical protein LX82_03282 [Celeribacter halophilus]SFK00703.1 hypothetical protein SAMN04488138_11920 [Celeribacter halophilus]